MRSPVILRIFKGTQLVEVKQFDKDQIIFGNGGDADVQLADPSVSPIHCLIELRDSGYYVADLGSTSGTVKQGQPVLDEGLSSGDQITIGAFVVHFFVGVPKPKTPPPGVATNTQAAAPTSPVAPTPAATEAAAPKAKISVVPSAQENKQSRPKLPEVGKGDSLATSQQKSKSKSSKRSRNTFAPPNQISDLRTYLRPTKGPLLEVLVAWKDRVISSQHFTADKKIVSLGSHSSCDISLPPGFVPEKLQFIELSGGTRVNLTSSMVPEIFQSEKKYDADMMLSLGKTSKGKSGSVVRLDQGELLSISIGDDTIQIFIRHIPGAPTPALAGIDLSAGELTGMIVSLVVVALLALYVSVYNQADQNDDKKEDQLRLAQFVYTQKEVKETKTPEPPPPKPTEPPKPVPPKKVEVAKNPKDTAGNPQKPAAMKDSAARA